MLIPGDAASPTAGDLALWACLAEASAPKAGNVHLGASFEDAAWEDFAAAALAVKPLLDAASERGVGRTVFEAVRVTQKAVGTNINLGILLLLAPLCAVLGSRHIESGIAAVLGGLSADDARQVYGAIRLSSMGGLGVAAQHDVRDDPPASLIEAMRAAASRDRVAAQYANGFDDVLSRIAPALAVAVSQGMALDQAIVRMHLELIAEGDSLIARKCGLDTATEAARRAKAVCDAGWPSAAKARKMFHEFDAWLRADGNRRNPGTSADLVTAGLFVALRERWIAPPLPWGETVSC